MASQSDPPALANESSKHARTIAEDLHARLVATAQQVAWANKHDFIQCSDVNKALLTLKQAGMEEAPPWYSRPNFFITLGSVLIGAAPSIASLAYTLISQSSNPYLFAAFVQVIPSFAAGIGVATCIYGWINDCK
jgi:hypothetical protein